MSARSVQRGLARLSMEGAVLAPERAGSSYGVFPGGDRRRRAVARLSGDEARMLETEGALRREGDGYVITEAGRALARRQDAAPGEAFAAQHRPIVDRTVIAGDGVVARVRGHDSDQTLRKLASLRDASGAAWLSAAELAAASRLRADWERGERGLVRGSDWSAPPNGKTARSPSNARESALAAHCDARRRVAESLERLALPLRRIVECVCLREEGLEALERSEAWPARSGKLALKLALAQLASA